MPREERIAEIAGLIERWCPRAFAHEAIPLRTARAFLNAIACVEDLRRQLEGEPPIRNDYPDPAYPPKP